MGAKFAGHLVLQCQRRLRRRQRQFELAQSLVVKQDDITRLNLEGARLVADLSHAHAAA